MTTPIAPYRVTANNTAKDSENKMHDDTVARQFGFSGGLVTGVDLLAYMLHVPVATYGYEFLMRGLIEARYLKPVYDGEMLSIEADEVDGRLALRLMSRGEVCASGSASLPNVAPAIDLVNYPQSFPVSDRRPVDASSFPLNDWLGAAPAAWPADAAETYRRDVRDEEPLYELECLVHPGVIQRLMNRVLVENAVLGPWIHVGSRMQLLSEVEFGDKLNARAQVVANYEKKGHRFVELDAVVVANGTRPVAHCHHIAIIVPRQERAAA